MKEDLIENIQVLWEFLSLNNKPKKSECIIGLGSILDLVAVKCAKLYNDNLGNYIVFSGNCGKGTKGIIKTTEAERFKQIAIKENVPEDKILIEPEATTTYENIEYIKKLLQKNKLTPKTFLIVGKPYQERRAQAIAELKLKDKEFQVASFNMKLYDYLIYIENNDYMKIEDLINEMVGEISLMKLAPKYGLQNTHNIPKGVEESFNILIEAGYSKYNYTEEAVKSFKDKMLNKRFNLIVGGINMNLSELEEEIRKIKERNARVELDKKWETCWTRRICICILTYIVVIVYSYVIRRFNNIFLSSLVPVIGFTLSTLSLKIIRNAWEKKNK